MLTKIKTRIAGLNPLLREWIALLAAGVFIYAGYAVVAHADQARPATLPVKAVHKFVGDPGGQCSAVMIAPSRALTAAHCKEIPNGSLIIDGVAYPVAGVYVIREGVDLAMMVVPSAPCPCATVKGAPEAEGSALYVVGYPRGLLRAVTQGTVQGSIPLPDYDGQTYGVTDARTAPGNSGGGVFNSDGQLIGIITATDGHLSLYVELAPLGVK